MIEEKVKWRVEEVSKIVSALRKKTCGKEPDRIETKLIENMAVVSMTGVLTPVEKFICQTEQGKRTVRDARTELIKRQYQEEHPVHLEEVVGANFVELFTDINIEKDWALTVFVFDRPIDGK
ncbi:Na-translocating system protein MpsC family protein [Microaerobacter geothermalis]|uniref:DUF2294 domain-containing protein n=1 Tax=Microaerobacter geothermalis TaxID=674972 RepID=UPI001F41BC31|nr:Na-translocating system protein MpsC family protein [Microaerobacter geothermalis]MCF6095016.1 Na-translocating system protein MpsC family protein [Microaerobacter geothermalis]